MKPDYQGLLNESEFELLQAFR